MADTFFSEGSSVDVVLAFTAVNANYGECGNLSWFEYFQKISYILGNVGSLKANRWVFVVSPHFRKSFQLLSGENHRNFFFFHKNRGKCENIDL